ncbi:hypothetical protein L810_3722 [Burkholderia sp. AU4i]|nr:hypothetical protein L810_3722 [Burkholderia sp. AU4i]QOH34910.1 hypothetical protein C7S14_5540 [Burkholderia cepacia]
MQQAKPLFWFSHKEEKSDTSFDVSLFYLGGQCAKQVPELRYRVSA